MANIMESQLIILEASNECWLASEKPIFWGVMEASM